MARNHVWHYTLRLFHTFALFEKTLKKGPRVRVFSSKKDPWAPQARLIWQFCLILDGSKKHWLLSRGDTAAPHRFSATLGIASVCEKLATLAPKSMQKVTKNHKNINKMRPTIMKNRGCVADAFLVRFCSARGCQKGSPPEKVRKKGIQTWMQKAMPKKSWKLCQTASKMMPKWMPKSMKNRCDFGTCDFLVFAKSITLKSYFYMIRGATNQPKINKKSMQKQVRRNDAKMTQKWAKSEPTWSPKCIQNLQKGPKGSQRATTIRKIPEKRHAKNDAKIWYRKRARKVQFWMPFWFPWWTPGGKEGKPPKAALRWCWLI